MLEAAYEVLDYFRVGDIINHRVKFDLPLSYYGKPSATTIAVVGTVTQKYDKLIHDNDNILPKTPKVICYIQGGPGFPCAQPLAKSGYTEVLLDNGYQIFYLDQRGTGLSTPLEVDSISQLLPQEKDESEDAYTKRQLDFILNFRADSIVEDYERIRSILLGNDKWSLLGQSFGGFCTFTYLSKYASSLKEVLITGGVPPVNHTSEDVYLATYSRTKERNIHYYNKYPQDIPKVKNILSYLASNDVTLPNGGKLTVERFQQLGLSFGGHGGTDSIHQLVFKFDYDLTLYGKPTYQSLTSVQNSYSFDTNIIYALFQEAIYCDGNNPTTQKTDWTADRFRYLSGNEQFVFNESSLSSEEPVFFTGEMVYKSMLDDYKQLKPLKALANALHSNTSWTPLYDVDVLRSITWDKVPIVAATYYNDQYVDFTLTMKVKQEVFQNNGNLKQYITSEFFHNGVRADAPKVIGSLLRLIELGDVD